MKTILALTLLILSLLLSLKSLGASTAKDTIGDFKTYLKKLEGLRISEGGPAEFRGKVFTGQINNEGVRLKSGLRFIDCLFLTDVQLGLVKMGSEISFRSCDFRGDVFVEYDGSFSRDELNDFEGRVTFSRCDFWNENTVLWIYETPYAQWEGCKFNEKTRIETNAKGVQVVYSQFEKESSVSLMKATAASLRGTSVNESLRLLTLNRSTMEFFPLHSELYPSKCVIDLIGCSVERIELNYQDYVLPYYAVGVIASYDEVLSVYERLLKKLRDKGLEDSYRKLDIEYQELRLTENPKNRITGSFVNAIIKVWNLYGYEKGRIWIWTGLFFLIFFLVNWMKFYFLIHQVYSVSALESAMVDKTRNNRRNRISVFLQIFGLRTEFALLSILYTLLIFFGVRLQTDRFKYFHFSWVIYILFQYTVGIICLAYLANFIITSGVIGE